MMQSRGIVAFEIEITEIKLQKMSSKQTMKKPSKHHFRS
jgi:hypothetical protein